MIVVIVLLSILNQIEINLVQNRKENCHHDNIPFNLRGNGILVFSVYASFIFGNISGQAPGSPSGRPPSGAVNSDPRAAPYPAPAPKGGGAPASTAPRCVGVLAEMFCCLITCKLMQILYGNHTLNKFFYRLNNKRFQA